MAVFRGGHTAPSVRSCEKIGKPGPDTVFAPRNRLKIRNCPARKGQSVPDFSIFSQLLQRGDRLELVVGLRSGRRWVIPAHGASSEARQFELEAGRLFAD